MASKRRLRRRGCEGKKGFETQNEAQLSALKGKEITTEHYSTYRCEFCGKIHVGRRPRETKSSRENFKWNRTEG